MSVRVTLGGEDAGEQVLLLVEKTTGNVVSSGWVDTVEIDKTCRDVHTAVIRLTTRLERLNASREEHSRRLRREQETYLRRVEELRSAADEALPDFSCWPREELAAEAERLTAENRRMAADVERLRAKDAYSNTVAARVMFGKERC